MRKAIIAATLISLLIVVGCSTHIHTVGSGPQSYEIVEARQWYILFGLVPLNTVDTKTMAAGATDYEIKTEQSPLDILMNIFTGQISIYSRTVTVTK